MVAAARLRRAQMRIEAARPYALNMLEFIGQLVRYIPVGGSEYPLLKPHKEVKKVAIIALTADRGLAGAFNSNIMRRAFDLVDTYEGPGRRQRPRAFSAARGTAPRVSRGTGSTRPIWT